MKPFIINASEGDRYVLRLQTEGVRRDQIADAFFRQEYCCLRASGRACAEMYVAVPYFSK